MATAEGTVGYRWPRKAISLSIIDSGDSGDATRSERRPAMLGCGATNLINY